MVAQKSSKNDTSATFSAEERAAMKEHAAELKKAARRGTKATKADGEHDVLEKIDEMTGSDRAIAERIHAIIKDVAPDLTPKTYYGMPAYAKDGKVLCFFQSAAKFNSRYATFGFNDTATLDDGTLWPTAFAITTPTPTPANEALIADLVKKAVS
ncbi:iron chaperone [Nocardia crassostreae]|uniref:iron chaperone n=1 Tax=Nocardia crassostreae TaxID=53428 RepID=UPI0008360B39|nr:DUF1801 domain-containing protein [Nocardia crassostreae]